MTTIAFVAGMLPLLIGTGPGAEERRSIAVLAVGGQTLSLLLTLLAVPVVYSFLDDLAILFRPKRKPAVTGDGPSDGEETRPSRSGDPLPGRRLRIRRAERHQADAGRLGFGLNHVRRRPRPTRIRFGCRMVDSLHSAHPTHFGPPYASSRLRISRISATWRANSGGVKPASTQSRPRTRCANRDFVFAFCTASFARGYLGRRAAGLRARRARRPTRRRSAGGSARPDGVPSAAVRADSRLVCSFGGTESSTARVPA